MKRQLQRFLAVCLIFSLCGSTVPVSGAAYVENEAGQQMQTITLPVVEEGDEMPPPQGLGHAVSTFALLPGQADTIYAYKGVGQISVRKVYILDPTTGDRVTEEPADNGILQLLDSAGEVVAVSEAISYYGSEYADDSYQSRNWYISYEMLEGTGGLAAGSYSLQLAAGNTTYPCEGMVEIVGSEYLLLESASVEGLYPGETELDVRASLFGFETEEDLSNLSFRLLDENGTEVAVSTGAYRDLNTGYSDGSWGIYAQMQVVDGQEILEGVRYSLQIGFAGSQTLVDAAGGVTAIAWEPSPEIVECRVLDTQTGLLAVDLKYLTPGQEYRVTATENGDSDVLASWSETAEGSTATVELQLARGGIMLPMSSYGYSLDILLYEGDRTYQEDNLYYENPYYNIQQEYLYFYPYAIQPTATSVEFWLEYHNGCSAYQGAGDVLSLRDESGTEVGRCDSMTLEQDGYSGTISGTLTITGALRDKRTYYLYLNGVQFDTLYVNSGLQLTSTINYTDHDSAFWMNFGQFPVTVHALNSGGTGQIVFQKDGADVLSSGPISGAQSEYDGYLMYQYRFSEEEFQALTPGESYTLLFRDDSGEERTLFSDPRAYDAEKTPLDPTNSNYIYVSWYEMTAGVDTIQAQIYFSGDGVRNIHESDLEFLTDITLTNGMEAFSIVSYSGNLMADDYQYRLTLQLDKPVTPGTYTVYWDGQVLESDIRVEAEEDKTTTIWSTGEEGYVSGKYLPVDSAYTGRIYQGYTCMTEEAFPLQLRGENNGNTQYLYYNKEILAGLKAGSYEVRVYQDGKILGSADLTLVEDTRPIITINDDDNDWSDSGDPVMHDPEILIEGSNMGAYSYLRWATTEQALAEAAFKPYFANRSYAAVLEGPDGPKDFYVELSKTGKAGDGENLIYTFNLWLCTDGDYDVQVPEEIQGVQDLDSWDSYTITATVELPAAKLWVTFIDGEGNYGSEQMTYVGPTSDGRYQYSLTFDLDDYIWDNNRQVYYKDTNSIRVFATDLSDQYHNGEKYRGNIMGEPVERFLIFGDPAQIILPQFSSGSVLVNQNSYTLYGYTTPGSAVTISENGSSLANGTANDYGYFSIPIAGLSEGTHLLTVSDNNEVTGDSTANLRVDTTPPVIEDVSFTFLDNGAAVIHWTCHDTDVDHFLVYKNNVLLGEASANSTSYNVMASADDGNTFSIHGVDKAGNVGKKTVSTADQEPPTAPSGLTVTGRTTTTLTLSWTAGTDNMGIDGYSIYAGHTLLAETEGEATQYTLTGLQQGTEYTLTVKTRDRAGNESTEGAELTVSTIKLSVSAQLDESYLADRYNSSKKIPLTFTVEADEADYKVSVRGATLTWRMKDGSTEGSAATAISSISGNQVTASWDISGAGEDGYLPMGEYELTLAAEDSYGARVVSTPVAVTLKRDDIPPTAPGAPQASSHSTTSITFRWEDATDNVAVDHYEIYRDGVKVGTTPSATYIDTGLEMGQSYSYTVKAADARGNLSQASPATSLSTMELAFDSVVTLDTSYIMEEQTDREIPVWAKFKPEPGYSPDVAMTLEYQVEGGAEWNEAALTVSTSDANLFQGMWDLSGSDTGYLPAGVYRVRFAVTDGSATAYSQVQTVTLQRDSVAPVVQSISPNDETRGGKDLSIAVTTTDNVGVVRVQLSYAAKGSAQFQPVGEMVRTGSQERFTYVWDASGLESGTYNIKVEAYDLRGNVGSATAAVIIDNTPPAAPTGLTVTGTSRYIHVMWDSSYQVSDDFYRFNVYRALSQDGPFTRVGGKASIGFFDDGESADAGETYYYYVTAEDDYGNESDPTQILSATLVADHESPEIGDMLPRDNASIQKRVTIQVTAADNYRLAKAVFSYRAAGTQDDWTEIATDTAEEVTNNTTFRTVWDISGLAGQYEIRAEVYDDSINDVAENSGYEANAPAVMVRTVTILPYSLPAAPVLTAQAGYKSAALQWTYEGSEDSLSRFTVYQVEGDELRYVTSVAAGARSCTVELPADGSRAFVVVAQDKYGESAQSAPVTVSSLSGETEPPVAVILPETLAAAAGIPFTFSAAASTDNDEIVSYAWQFGDESTGEGMICQHTYAQPGTYQVQLTVTDACGNRDTVQAEISVHDVTGEDAGYALATLTVVNGYAEGTPAVAGANVKCYADGFESSAVTDEKGQVVMVVPLGACTVSVTAEGYVAASRAVTVTGDQQGAFAHTIGLQPMEVSTVDGSLTVEEMTYDEILAAGIDVTDPDNSHVWKFAATLEFVAGPALAFKLPVSGYFNGAGQFISGSGWGWTTVGGGGMGGFNIGLFPISEKFVLVIYGEAHWLKEMYNVELLVINNSYTDDITDCVATLELPKGLSLAAMTGEAQSEQIDLGTIAHKTDADDGASTAKATWYVRGDAEGEYNLTATVTGNAPQPFLNTFTIDKPVKVYAGSALKLFITAEDIAFRGEEYHVQFKLQNVSDKDLYNLSFGITGAEQFKVVQIGDGEAYLELTQDDFGDGMTQAIDVLKPGGSITIDFSTTTWFNSVLELADLGPVDVGYYLTNVFVTTLEGNTTTIPYEVEIVHTSHGTFFEWLWDKTLDAAEDESVDLLDKAFFDEVPVVGTGLKVYKFITEDSTDSNSKAVITVENGYFSASNNFLRARTQPEGAVSVYTDASEENYEISADGTTMTITGSATIYVQGERAGKASMTVTTYADGEPNRYTMDYTVSGEAGEAEQVILQAPQSSQVAVPLAGETLQVTFPYALQDAQGNLLTGATNAQWTILGEDTGGLTMDKGVLTVDSTAKGGTYTIRLAVSQDVYAEQTIVLTREASQATALKLYRDGIEIVDGETLVIPVAGAGETYTYTAVLLDQYGVEMAAETGWTVETNSSSAACENGTITLTRDTTPGTIRLTASAAGQQATITVEITNLSVDWSGVETAIAGTNYIYGDPNNKVVLPERGTATATETVEGTFSVADGETVQDAGQRTITVNFTAGEGPYAGTVISKEFAIQIGRKALEETMVSVTGSYPYTGSPITPAYTVSDGSLMDDGDYTVECTNNIHVGTATITVTGQGNYSGTVSKTFTIVPMALTDEMVQPITGTFTYTGQAHTPEIAVMHGQLTLVEGTDYTVAYKDNINAGTAAVTVTGQGDYSGTASRTFTIDPMALTDEMVQPITGTFTYTGQAHTPEITVKNGEITLVKDADYTVTYENNTHAGTATVTAAGQGNYSGTVSVSFVIDAASLSGLTPTLAGTAKVGGVLAARLDGVEAGEYAWHWYRKSDNAQGYVEITGAEGKSFYVLTTADSNQVIYVEAVAREGGNYKDITLSSQPVQVEKQTITGIVSILVQGETVQSGTELTAYVEIDPDAAVAYQWNVDGVPAGDGTEQTFTVPEGSAGTSITVTVTPESGDLQGSITSAAVVVGQIPLTGTLTLQVQDGTITATAAGLAENSYEIVWLRNGTAVSGASGTSYAVTDTDKGTTITAKAVGKEGYTGEIVAQGVTIPATAPDAPVVSASAGNGQITVSWTVPHDGGAAITGYTLVIRDEQTAVATIGLDSLTQSYKVDGLTNGTAYTLEVTAANEVGTSAAGVAEATPKEPSGGGSSSGGTSTGSETETVTNPDGSTTTTVTHPDGSKTQTTKAPNGASSVVTTGKDGHVEAQVSLPAAVIDQAAESGDTVSLPMPALSAAAGQDGAPTVTMDLPANTAAKVEIPVANVTPGTVAVMVEKDGTERVIANTLTTDSGIVVTLTDGDTVKIVDNSRQFADVPDTHWADGEITFVASRGLFNGTGANLFTPAGDMTRAMVMTVLARYEGIDTDGGETWYEVGVRWAVEQGISDGTHLETAISREQLVTMLWRYAGSPETTGNLSGYPDHTSVSDWAVDAMIWAVDNGIITGTGAGLLNPQGTASRAEVAAILARFVCTVN